MNTKEELLEAINTNIRKVGRVKIARLRIRNGKVLRNKKISGKKGYEFSHGKIKRMGSMEKRNRKIATRRARFKIRSKLGTILRKRKAALRKRKALGG